MIIYVWQEALRGRRCASLRSAATPVRGAEESGRSTPSAAHRASPSPADTPAPKKSNWEVIEHFSSSKSKRSPTAVSITLLKLLQTVVGATRLCDNAFAQKMLCKSLSRHACLWKQFLRTRKQ